MEVSRCIRAFSEQQRCEIVELNIQVDHVHLLAMVPPKVSISDYVGTIKGQSAIRVFNKFRKLKDKPYGGPNRLDSQASMLSSNSINHIPHLCLA